MKLVHKNRQNIQSIRRAPPKKAQEIVIYYRQIDRLIDEKKQIFFFKTKALTRHYKAWNFQKYH